MANPVMTTEVFLSVAIIILTVLAIAVFIIYGPGALFYGLFAITVLVMLFTWYRISYLGGEQAPQKARAKAKPKRKR